MSINFSRGGKDGLILINYSGSSKSNIKVESHGFHSTLPTPCSFSLDYTTASQPNQGGEAIPLLLRCQLVRFRRLLPVLLAGEGCRAGVCPDFSALEPPDRGYGRRALQLAPFFMGPGATIPDPKSAGWHEIDLGGPGTGPILQGAMANRRTGDSASLSTA